MKHQLSLILGLLLPSPGSPAMAQPATPPNIIVILADDLYGAYGARLIKTPHIDRLAEAGVRLTDFYASSNVCSPSRAGLLTGRYAVRDGLAARTVAGQTIRAACRPARPQSRPC